jgi:hypothetical protein
LFPQDFFLRRSGRLFLEAIFIARYVPFGMSDARVFDARAIDFR